MTKLQTALFDMQDITYRDFHSRLIPNIEKDRVIGIRTPILRKFAKEYAKTDDAQKFIRELPHYYYEENNLHMMIITGIKDYDTCVIEIERFLPYIDNWATCDLPVPKCFYKNKEKLIDNVISWIKSDDTYTIRYGIETLMSIYLDDAFESSYPRLVSEVISDEYYVNMMIAWYFATALAKQWEAVIPYIEEKRLPEWVHKKTIQKAVESYRITDEQKKYLRALR